jgi:hypothetical protein
MSTRIFASSTATPSAKPWLACNSPSWQPFAPECGPHAEGGQHRTRPALADRSEPLHAVHLCGTAQPSARTLDSNGQQGRSLFHRRSPAARVQQ